MEAMTVMGMAASQARFLGLTARKSNVEYQGQQINQERTALSNESANLYNQMMNLDVPVPPSTSDYYQTSYVLDNSQDSTISTGDYEMTNFKKVYGETNKYLVTLTYDRVYTKETTSKFILHKVEEPKKSDKGNDTYTFKLSDTGFKDVITTLTYTENEDDAYTGSVTSDNKSGESVSDYVIYKVDKTNDRHKSLTGYEECCKDDNTQYYFYRDNGGKNHFLTQAQLDDFMANKGDSAKELTVSTSEIYEYTKPESLQVTASLEKSKQTDRYSAIKIDTNENYPSNLSGKEYGLSTVRTMDEDGYKDAYNDYEYNKDLYEQTINDINAQTEIIQKEDQQLELRLQQLNTEQNAISTEMDSVSKVIEDNVEKTFKVFA